MKESIASLRILEESFSRKHNISRSNASPEHASRSQYMRLPIAQQNGAPPMTQIVPAITRKSADFKNSQRQLL